MIVLFSLIVASYFTLMIILRWGWQRAVRNNTPSSPPVQGMISVLIPLRNEEEHVSGLIQLLARQNERDFEVLLVDDHSDDQTRTLAESLSRGMNNFTVVSLKGKKGKKAAVSLGVKHARGEIIVTTDADCEFGPAWLSTIRSCFSSEDVKMVCGAVKVAGRGRWAQLQSLEFASLVASGAATLGLGWPTMCNAANMAYRKKVFNEGNGYTDGWASGDDQFLLHKVHAAYPDGIRFMVDHDALVTTNATTTFRDFVWQRLRWASKWRAQGNMRTGMLALMVFLFHASMIALYTAVILGWVSGWAALLVAVRALADLLLLSPATRRLGIRRWWGQFILVEFIYPFYAVGIAILCNVIPYPWKGRRYPSIAPDDVNLSPHVRTVAKEQI